MSAELLQSLDRDTSGLSPEETICQVDALLAKFHTSTDDLGPVAWTVSIDKTGMNSTVFLAKSSHANIVIKHATNPYSRKAILREQEKLSLLWKQDSAFTNLSFPRPLGFLVDKDLTPHHMVFGLLPGVNGAEAMRQCEGQEDRLDLISAFAVAVKLIHESWRPLEFPLLRLESFKDELNLQTVKSARDWVSAVVEREYKPNIMERAAEMISKGGEEDVENGRDALAYIENLDEVLSLPPSNQFWSREELVFLHGDCMLPNFLFSRDEEARKWVAVGVLDLGDSGFGDRRFDLQAAVWSLRYNLELAGAKLECDVAEALFLKGYDIEKDEEGWSVFGDVYDLFDFYAYAA
ncbi:hypothetical protein HDU98_004234 [Podochytrium sp. JEL0797]|nr:hypothetical protein HDU98_004234 [Podochytrium sp. JEL0797]